MSDNASHPGLAQRLAANLVGLAHNHLSLFSIELEEERERLLGMLLLGLIGVVVIALSLVLLSIALVWWVDVAQRGVAILALGVFYLLAGAACLLVVRNQVARAPKPFAATLNELRKDKEQFLP
ncbi:phage holin family protein [Andreprevotia chitinilytica]|uniref:phage holin family protein n=1 Tax=Andreprevotia chitinilytica TaxID=396808 RepID=UPI00054F6ADD|nr:phage holin family protein [Andreprevotia chitinilytica]